MISILVPYRNRDLQRVKMLLDSLVCQKSKCFEIHFIDYGSTPTIAAGVKELCGDYSFVKYSYHWTQFQPWNKSKALNSVIRNLDTEFCFIADVDFYFHPSLIQKLEILSEDRKNYYFQVGFLEEGEEPGLEDFKGSFRKSTEEATGLSLFNVATLKALRGFDEFYHFWGAEDTDMHVRLRNNGSKVHFYEEKVLMLHQWHPSYRKQEKDVLTSNFQVEGIVQLNHQHLKNAVREKTTLVNSNNWGHIMTKGQLDELEAASINFRVSNEVCQIDELLFGQLPKREGVFKFTVEKDAFQDTTKYILKRTLGKKVPHYYSLKEVNDKVLLHLISFYREYPYTFKIREDLRSLEVAINFTNFKDVPGLELKPRNLSGANNIKIWK